MIVDHIRNRSLYYGLGDSFRKGLDYLAAYKPGATEFRDDILEGEDLFVRIRPTATRPVDEARLESHLDYADIHYVAKGTEIIGYADVHSLKVIEEYNKETDTMFLEGDFDLITLREGYFLIAGIDDAHMPSLTLNESKPFEKLVVKIRLKE